MSKIPCSVPILTLNSEKYLGRCLESLKDFEDVYLVDGNSTDGTHAIALKYGRRIEKQVLTEEKNVRITDFTAVRKRAISLAKYNWILDLDSDEYVSEDLPAEVSKAIHSAPEQKKVFEIQGKVVIGGKRIEHAFNYPNFTIRLYDRLSGVVFASGKTVHEHYFVPDDVETVRLHTGVIYSDTPASYAVCIEKDTKYLGIVKQKFFSAESKKRRKRLVALRALFLNLGRSVKILLVSLGLYVRYGFKNTLPFPHVWRYVRYHLIISWFRLRQIF